MRLPFQALIRVDDFGARRKGALNYLVGLALITWKNTASKSTA